MHSCPWSPTVVAYGCTYHTHKNTFYMFMCKHLGFYLQWEDNRSHTVLNVKCSPWQWHWEKPVEVRCSVLYCLQLGAYCLLAGLPIICDDDELMMEKMMMIRNQMMSTTVFFFACTLVLVASIGRACLPVYDALPNFLSRCDETS